jgi:hypothetical protein
MPPTSARANDVRVALTIAICEVLTLAYASPARAETCYQDASGHVVTRRRPGFHRVECPNKDAPAAAQPPPTQAPADRRSAAPVYAPIVVRPTNPVSPIPRPNLDEYVSAVPMPDRWRIVDALGTHDRWWDPYNRNILKGDTPVHDDWFFNLAVMADSVVEARNVPTPVGTSSTEGTGEVDVFGGNDQAVAIENVAVEFVYYKGDTVFKPPEYEFRFTPVFNTNYTRLEEIGGVDVDPRDGRARTDTFVGIQQAFVDKHLRNVSDQYDFDSIRVGIQPFSTDFRGFLFQDNQLGVRLFGNRRNNRVQYNAAWFRRIEKDTNSGLNDVSQALRDDDIFVANLYWQDLPLPGFTSQAIVAYNRNGEDHGTHYNDNGFIERPASFGEERPRSYDVGYIGYNGDGHFGRLNLTTSAYFAFGQEDGSVFVSETSDIQAMFAAAEASLDFDWIRAKISFLYGSGDDDPFDDKSTGYDAIFENPQFAGADNSYWIRQAVPLIGGGRVNLSTRNGVLANLRSSKDEGQSNFVNPGIWLLGAGIDFDVLPQLRISMNWNSLWFDETQVLETARNQGSIDTSIGQDVSASATYRPLMSQNIVLRASYAKLFAGDGFEALYGDDDPGYFLFNLVLTF